MSNTPSSKSLDFLQFSGLDMQIKWNRQLSLKAFKSPHVQPEALAENGFFYYGQGDAVECYACGANLGSWVEGDDPKVEHKKYAPDCPMTNDGNDNPDPEPYCQVEPTFALYANIHKRLETFAIWPSILESLIHPLAEAGFFYSGLNDKTTCFFCSGNLDNWQVGDDPWFRHADIFPYCKYVDIIKGFEYIVNIKFKKNHNPDIDESPAELPINNEYSHIPKNLCIICKSDSRSYLFKRCGHIAVCQKCLPKDKICPICRLPYEKEIKIFYSYHGV
ncbi:baculoviral IAP repeat-containing protein 7-B-like [Arctopsyche grandis]|uniref:baculoviral IAP repeat-containing protein 7-B-like n=1 Tax=Arctopsyche grandis TaxID=121162 RepID=UPI00406D9F83